MRLGWVALSSWACAACSDSTATQVIVQLHAEAEIATLATSVHVIVENDEGDVVLDKHKQLDGAAGRIARIPLIPKGDDPTRRFVVRAELSGSSGAVIGRAEAHAGYVEDELRALNLWFWNACQGKSCEAGRTCQRGVCRGACFETVPAEATQPSEPTCRECEQCLGRCEPADGASCGCPSETCSGRDCVPNDRVSFVAAGFKHTCAALSTGDVHCWGVSEGFGRLGVGADTESPKPLLVPGVRGSQGVVASGNHSCALSPSSRYCWGENDVGQLGDGTTTDADTAPVQIDNSTHQMAALSIGYQHTCGSSQGNVWCWGHNAYGQLGLGSTGAGQPSPQAVGSGYSHVSAGGEHTCAIETGGVLECWGHNESLQVGVTLGATIASPVRPGCEDPNAARCFDDWSRVGAGGYHSCAIRQDRQMYCWGSNQNGQLGIGSALGTTQVAEPERVVGDVQWSDVEAGSHHTCALDIAGALYCWGRNEDRQLGLGDSGFVGTPARLQVDAPAGWRQLSLGETHTCAIRDDRTLWCWGRNVEGQIGIGAKTAIAIDQPTRVCF